MFDFLEKTKNKCFYWFKDRAESRAVKVWLALIAFGESIIFPIPTVAFLMPIFMSGVKRWFYFAGFATLFSILGGIAGYVVGFFLFDTIGTKIVDFYGLEKEFLQVQSIYQSNVFWVTLVGAFTPVPYKIFTLSAGVLSVSFLPFLIASIIGRGAQFFLVAYVMKYFGAVFTRIFLRYFNILAFAIVGIAILLFLF